ncbi:ferrous iron transport protein B [Intestinibacillus massiliensis]|nr:ferrous iron transport protein B [Intestinibacillus massiliensis]
MPITIALAGNPNCGKTTMFNDLTGSNQYVGNWPGVTVEKKSGKLRGHKDVRLMDLPGVYSLSPYTLEEVVSRNYLLDQDPDVILNLVDASNIERNLYLTTQLLEVGAPVVIALNMMDVVRKNGDRIDTAKLSRALGCPVVETAAVKGQGSMEAAEAAIRQAKLEAAVPQHRFSEPVEQALAAIEAMVADVTDEAHRRWFSIKLFERDAKVLERFQFGTDTRARLEEIIVTCEDALDDDAESIITNGRYTYISGVVKECVVKKAARGTLTTSDRIDRIVTNRWLALPIFAAVMALVYYVSVTTIGTIVTDWTNDVLFGEIIPPAAEGFLVAVGCAPWLQSLILDGIIAGVGAVLGFVPQMLVLFLFLAVLEDCGYMARVAFIMDRIFRKFGLSGKSFIPMLIGSGCGVPAVMASRTIEQERDRRMTIMTTTFVPCGAKMPIIALFAGAIFGGAGWVAWSAYFIGIGAIIVSGILLKKTRMFAGDPAPFVMELPQYHIPTAGNVLRSMWERGWSFIKKAGTVILLSTIVIWFAQSYGFENGAFGAVEDMDNSILAALGNVIAPVFAPLGWGDWKPAVATVTGLVAKENVVATFGQLFHFAGELSEDGAEIWGTLAAAFTMLSAYSFMVFNLLCAPCFAAIGAIKREMNSAKWTWFAIGYMTVFAYTVSLMIYQFGTFLTGGGFGVGTAAATLVLAAYAYLLLRRPRAAAGAGIPTPAAGAKAGV